MTGIGVPKQIDVHEDLTQQMHAAGTYEELMSCWDDLSDVAHFDSYDDHMALNDIPEGEHLLTYLRKMYQCFSGSYECDTFCKMIWNEGLLHELDKMGIPRLFLLQTVRMGAIMGVKQTIERGPHVPMQLLYPYGERKHDLSGGFQWANDQMREIQVQKQKDADSNRELEDVRHQSQIDAAIQDVAIHMRDPGYSMPEDQKRLLRDSFKMKLIGWKAFSDAYLSNDAIAPFWSGEFADKEITPESYESFVDACESDDEIREDLLEDEFRKAMFEMVNPDSGWFYALIKNGKTTWRQFLSSAVSNMNHWFEL